MFSLKKFVFHQHVQIAHWESCHTFIYFMKGQIGGEINQCQRWQLVDTLPQSFHYGVLSTNFTVPGDGARDHKRQQGQRRVWQSLAVLADQTELTPALIPWWQKSGLLQLSSESPYITSLCIWSLCSALKLHCGPFPYLFAKVLRVSLVAVEI